MAHAAERIEQPADKPTAEQAERLVALLVRWRHFNRYTHSPKNIEAETDALLAELGR